MKKLLFLLLCALTTIIGTAQTKIYVCQGNSYTAFDIASIGDITFSADCKTLLIGNMEYETDAIDSVTFCLPAFAKTDEIRITYNGTAATVSIPETITDVTANVKGADVTLTSNTTSQEYTYIVEGKSDSGSLTLNGNYKLTLQLNGIQLTSASGAAIDIETGKRVSVILADGTTNTICDAADGSQKAAICFSGHPEFQGGGTLNVTGRTNHAIFAKEYLEIKKSTGTINVLGSIKDGIHCGKGKADNTNNYFLMKGGSLTMSNIGSDCIDSDDYGCADIKGGSLNLTVSSVDATGIKCDSLFTMTDGEINLTVTGESSIGIRSGYSATFNGGTITANITANGGKGISCKCYTDADKTVLNGGNIYLKGTVITQTLSGSMATDSTKCIGLKAEGDLNISGGTVRIESSGTTAKCISTDGNSTIADGTLYLKTTGNGSKCLRTEGSLTIGQNGTTGPSITAITTGSSTQGNDYGYRRNQESTSTRFPGGGGHGWNPDGRPDETSSTSSSAKAVKVTGSITMESGQMELSTATDGAEGLESKADIYLNGGSIKANCYDDCINATKTIQINGANVYCLSTGNDAIDSNYGRSGAFSITDGICIALSTKGNPEEGVDCDNDSYISIKGGYLFTAGGQQGNSSSSSLSATQGYYKLTGKTLSAQYLTLTDSEGNNIFTLKMPVAISKSYSFISTPQMKSGSKYTLTSGTTSPTDAKTEFNGFYIGSNCTGTTQVASFSAR